MAREYARIMTAIWRNREFRVLPEAAQRLYLLLVTQPDISAAGVLALRLRRWAEMSADSKPDDLVATLNELEAGRFIIVDFDSEEVLVRSFIRWDAGYTNSKRRPVIVRAAEEVDSPRLLRALALEFQRCELPPLALDGLPDSAPDRPSDADVMGYAAPSTDDTPNSLFPQLNSLSGRASGSASPSDGVVVTQVSREDPTTHNPETVPPPAARTDEITTAQAITRAYVDRVPMSRFPAVLGIVRKALKADHDADQVKAALLRLADEGRSVTVETLRIELEGAPPARRLRAVAGGHRADPSNGVYWEQ